MKILKKITLMSVILGSAIFAEEAAVKTNSLAEAFTNGKFKGTLGSYGEHKDYTHGGDKKDYGWLTGYLKLGYETARWNGLKLGVSTISHAQLADNSDQSDKYYDKDIEERHAIPELYLDYLISKKTNFRIGRYNHKKITHIDDSHSEGFYLRSKEIDNLDVVIGAMVRFAELDYDDMEDFGQQDGKQDLADKEHYGDSDDVLWFAEATYKIGIAEFNPFLYYQGGYATVYGMDTVLEGKVSEDVKLGTNIYAYGVDVDSDTDSEYADKEDGYGYNFEPFVKVGNWKVSIGNAGVSGKEGSVSKPAWFKDYLTGFDQDIVGSKAKQGMDVIYGKIAWKSGKWKAHAKYGAYTYDVKEDKGGINETELQASYKFTSKLDLNVRLFHVDYTKDAGQGDYDKVEARIRYKF